MGVKQLNVLFQNFQEKNAENGNLSLILTLDFSMDLAFLGVKNT